MGHQELLSTSTVELDRLLVVQRVAERRLTAVDAAQQLGLTSPHVVRLVKAYRQHGPEGQFSGQRGKRSNRAYSEAFKQQVLDIIRGTYNDFGPTLATEKLRERHDIDKYINDTLGHAAGDAFLVHSSKLVTDAIRANDQLAQPRYATKIDTQNPSQTAIQSSIQPTGVCRLQTAGSGYNTMTGWWSGRQIRAAPPLSRNTTNLTGFD